LLRTSLRQHLELRIPIVLKTAWIVVRIAGIVLRTSETGEKIAGMNAKMSVMLNTTEAAETGLKIAGTSVKITVMFGKIDAIIGKTFAIVLRTEGIAKCILRDADKTRFTS
jgi:hypothetical protein